MSLLLMPTDTPSPKGLFPSWRPLSQRSSKSPLQEDTSSPTVGGLLVPKPTSKSSSNEDSRSISSIRSLRSIRSSASRGQRLIRRIANRFGFPSKVGRPIDPLKEIEKLDKSANWLDGFTKYNQLVTCLASKDPSYTPDQFAKACETLTKKCKGGFLHGLPEAVFDLGLLWCPSERMRKVEDSTEPSWSWKAWEKEDPKGVQAAVNFPFDPTTCPDIPEGESEIFKSAIQCYKVGFTESESNLYTVRRDRNLRMEVPSYVPQGECPTEDSQMLRFEAESIPLTNFLPKQIADGDRDIPCSELIDKETNCQCGVLMQYADLISQEDTRPARFDFILLSKTRCCKPSRTAERPDGSTIHHPPGTPLWGGEGFIWDKQVVDHDETMYQDGGSNGEWDMLNVMLIQTLMDKDEKEELFSERVAIGRIHEEAWKARKPQRRKIKLM